MPTNPSGPGTNNYTGDATIVSTADGLFGIFGGQWAKFAGPFTQRVCRAKLDFAVDGGAVGTIIPATNDTIPANAVIMTSLIQAVTAVTSAGSATLAVGLTTTATNAIMAATAKASLGLAAFGQATPVPQTSSTWVKTSGTSQVTFTVAVAALTAGVVEVLIPYYVLPE